MHVIWGEERGRGSGPNLGGGRPRAHLAWWIIGWVTGLAHIKDYGIQSASILAVMHYYEYYQYDYSFLTVNSNVKHKLSKSGVKDMTRQRHDMSKT